MKKISLVLTFLSITFFKAIAQQVPKNDGTKTEIKNINDDDGDGIVNTEDACPLEKGDKANNGCPTGNTNLDKDEILLKELKQSELFKGFHKMEDLLIKSKNEPSKTKEGETIYWHGFEKKMDKDHVFICSIRKDVMVADGKFYAKYELDKNKDFGVAQYNGNAEVMYSKTPDDVAKAFIITTDAKSTYEIMDAYVPVIWVQDLQKMEFEKQIMFLVLSAKYDFLNIYSIGSGVSKLSKTMTAEALEKDRIADTVAVCLPKISMLNWSPVIFNNNDWKKLESDFIVGGLKHTSKPFESFEEAKALCNTYFDKMNDAFKKYYLELYNQIVFKKDINKTDNQKAFDYKSSIEVNTDTKVISLIHYYDFTKTILCEIHFNVIKNDDGKYEGSIWMN